MGKENDQPETGAEIDRLRACMERAKNGLGGLRRYFENDDNAIGLAMLEGVYMDLDETLMESDCDHEWTDARNKVIQSGELCLKCYAVRAGNTGSVCEADDG